MLHLPWLEQSAFRDLTHATLHLFWYCSHSPLSRTYLASFYLSLPWRHWSTFGDVLRAFIFYLPWRQPFTFVDLPRAPLSFICPGIHSPLSGTHLALFSGSFAMTLIVALHFIIYLPLYQQCAFRNLSRALLSSICCLWTVNFRGIISRALYFRLAWIKEIIFKDFLSRFFCY